MKFKDYKYFVKKCEGIRVVSKQNCSVSSFLVVESLFFVFFLRTNHVHSASHPLLSLSLLMIPPPPSPPSFPPHDPTRVREMRETSFDTLKSLWQLFFFPVYLNGKRSSRRRIRLKPLLVVFDFGSWCRLFLCLQYRVSQRKCLGLKRVQEKNPATVSCMMHISEAPCMHVLVLLSGFFCSKVEWLVVTQSINYIRI